MTLAGIRTVLKMSPRPTIVLSPDYPRFTIAEVNQSFASLLRNDGIKVIDKGLIEAFNLVVSSDDPEVTGLLDGLDYVVTAKTSCQTTIAAEKLGIKGIGSANATHIGIELYPVLSDPNNVEYIVMVITDNIFATDSQLFKSELYSRRLAELERLEKVVLELNSKKDFSIQDVLTYYINGIEGLFAETLCSILQIKNRRLYNLASPSLPQFYVEALEGLEISEYGGSCGTAAYLKKIVIVEDINNDIRWTSYKEQAAQADLKACWAHPIIDSEGEVMATFAIYYRKIKAPAPNELKMIERAVSLLKVILENRKNSEILKETTLLMTQGQELAHFGNWAWDIKNNVVNWSDSLYTIYGLDKHSFKATFEGYLELLHPDERERVRQIIQNVLITQKDVEFEERIIRPNGELRYLRSWGKLKTDDKGVPEKMIGACLDITESKKIQEELVASETRLRSLAWAQSHLVRGPLTRIMGITELLCNKDTDQSSRSQLLVYLESSARELDKVIKDIVNKSY